MRTVFARGPSARSHPAAKVSASLALTRPEGHGPAACLVSVYFAVVLVVFFAVVFVEVAVAVSGIGGGVVVIVLPAFADAQLGPQPVKVSAAAVVLQLAGHLYLLGLGSAAPHWLDPLEHAGTLPRSLFPALSNTGFAHMVRRVASPAPGARRALRARMHLLRYLLYAASASQPHLQSSPRHPAQWYSYRLRKAARCPGAGRPRPS